MDRLTLVLCLCWLPGVAMASDDERARIAAQRQTQAAAFEAQERACASRFSVTACIDDVRARRREAQAPLREQLLRLDEMDRHRRAVERRAAIEAKQAAAAARPPVGSTPQLRLRKPPQPTGATPPEPDLGTAAPHDRAERSAQAQKRRREALQREREAQATRARIQQRQAQRQASGRKVDALPEPAAASAPGR